MLGIDEIMAVLPHRYPFLMVDAVSELSEERILAQKNVSVNEPFFPGHFPDYPVMPGVLLIEALAQAGVLLASFCGGFDPKRQRVFFASVDRAKFRKPVRPGQQVELDVVPLRKGAKVWKLKGEARVAGDVVAEAELVAMITPREEGD